MALSRNVFLQLLHFVFHHSVLYCWLLGGVRSLTVITVLKLKLLRTAYFNVLCDEIYKKDVSKEEKLQGLSLLYNCNMKMEQRKYVYI